MSKGLINTNITFIVTLIFGSGLFYGTVESKLEELNKLSVTQSEMQKSIDQLVQNQQLVRESVNQLMNRVNNVK